MKNLLLFSSLLLPLSLLGQTFKADLVVPDFPAGESFQIRELMQVPGTNQFMLTGDLKGPSPDYMNRAFYLRTNHQGEPVIARTWFGGVSTSANGIRSASIATDSEGNVYLGGALVQAFQGLGRGSEKTIVSMDGSGQINWSVMAPNWGFEDLDFHPRQQQLYTLSGPDDGLYPADLLLGRFAKDGRRIDGYAFETATENEAVELVPGDAGTYYVVGTGSADLSPHTFVMQVDTALDFGWAFSFEQAGFAYRPADAAWHPDGYLLVAGSVETLADGKMLGFVLAINDDGSSRFLRHLALQDHESLQIEGVAGVRNSRYPENAGLLLAGTARVQGGSATSAVVFALDTLGDLRWVQSYSDFPSPDIEVREGFTDIIYLPDYEQFAAAGHTSVRNYGLELTRRRGLLLRAPVSDGQMDDNGHCLSTVQGSSDAYTVMVTPVAVNRTAEGGSQSFVYQESNLAVYPNWCTLEYQGSGTGSGDPGTGRRRQEHPFADEMDRFQLGVVTTQGSTQSIQMINPGGLTGLEAELIDMQGRMIFKESLSAHQDLITVRTGSLAQGLYLLRVTQAGRTMAAKRILPGPFAQ